MSSTCGTLRMMTEDRGHSHYVNLHGEIRRAVKPSSCRATDPVISHRNVRVHRVCWRKNIHVLDALTVAYFLYPSSLAMAESIWFGQGISRQNSTLHGLKTHEIVRDPLFFHPVYGDTFILYLWWKLRSRNLKEEVRWWCQSVRPYAILYSPLLLYLYYLTDCDEIWLGT